MNSAMASLSCIITILAIVAQTEQLALGTSVHGHIRSYDCDAETSAPGCPPPPHASREHAVRKGEQPLKDLGRHTASRRSPNGPHRQLSYADRDEWPRIKPTTRRPQESDEEAMFKRKPTDEKTKTKRRPLWPSINVRAPRGCDGPNGPHDCRSKRQPAWQPMNTRSAAGCNPNGPKDCIIIAGRQQKRSSNGNLLVHSQTRRQTDFIPEFPHAPKRHIKGYDLVPHEPHLGRRGASAPPVIGPRKEMHNPLGPRVYKRQGGESVESGHMRAGLQEDRSKVFTTRHNPLGPRQHRQKVKATTTSTDTSAPGGPKMISRDERDPVWPHKGSKSFIKLQDRSHEGNLRSSLEEEQGKVISTRHNPLGPRRKVKVKTTSTDTSAPGGPHMISRVGRDPVWPHRSSKSLINIKDRSHEGKIRSSLKEEEGKVVATRHNPLGPRQQRRRDCDPSTADTGCPPPNTPHGPKRSHRSDGDDEIKGCDPANPQPGCPVPQPRFQQLNINANMRRQAEGKQNILDRMVASNFLKSSRLHRRSSDECDDSEDSLKPGCPPHPPFGKRGTPTGPRQR